MYNIDTYISPSKVLPPKVPEGASKSEIRKVAEDFEGMFVAEMMRPIFDDIKTEDDPYFGGGHGEEMFKSMLVDEYGKSLSASGSLGIADMIEAQLIRLEQGQ